MPWKETCAMDQRVQFIGDLLSGQYSKSDLCRYYGISRPTGDKWIERYQRWGVEGLKERSRAARTHPNAVAPEVCELPPVEYGAGVTVRRVRQNGEIKWKGHLLYVSDLLAKEPLGLSPVDEYLWEVRYSFHLLGVLDERTLKINPPRQWHGKGEQV